MGENRVDCRNLKLVDPRWGQCCARRYKAAETGPLPQIPGGPSRPSSPKPPKPNELLSDYSPPSEPPQHASSLPYPVALSIPLGVFRLGITVVLNGVAVSSDRLKLERFADLYQSPRYEDHILYSGVQTVASFPANNLEWWKLLSTSPGFERMCLNPSGQYCLGATLTLQR